MMENLSIIEATAWIATLVLIASMFIAVYRLVRGPTLADRAAALDLITVLAIAVAGTSAIVLELPVFLDIGVTLALVSFLATLAFAWYIERRAERPTTNIEGVEKGGVG